MTVKRNKKRKKYSLEYLIINLFVFVGIWLLSFVVFNVSLFDQFTQAFRDFTLTDIYYSQILNKNKIYKGPLVLINIENKNREEIAFLLQRLEEGKPKVVALDLIFPDKKDSASDELLKQTLHQYNNLVLPYIAAFDKNTIETKNNEFFQVKSTAFVNLVGEHREYSTVRYYCPIYNNIPSFTTAVIQMYDPLKAALLLKRGQQKTEIRYFGNLQNFAYQTFDEVMNPSFNPDALKDKIVLIGYMGLENGKTNPLDEDKFFTPLNPQLSGRSHPDMYGSVMNANIIRMALDKDHIYAFPSWLNWTLAFMLSWVLLPMFVRWYVHKAVWFHLFTMFIQLLFSIFFVFFTIWLYALANIKIESSAVLIAILLMGDFLLFYDHLVKFLKYKLKWNFHSKFLEGGH